MLAWRVSLKGVGGLLGLGSGSGFDLVNALLVPQPDERPSESQEDDTDDQRV
jgi:hypothetical protein